MHMGKINLGNQLLLKHEQDNLDEKEVSLNVMGNI